MSLVGGVRGGEERGVCKNGGHVECVCASSAPAEAFGGSPSGSHKTTKDSALLLHPGSADAITVGVRHFARTVKTDCGAMAEILDAPSCVSIPHPHATPHWRSHAQAGEGQSDGLDRLAAAVGGLETSSAWTAPPPFPQAVLAEAAAAQAAHALVSAAAGARRHRPGCTTEMGMALRQRRQRLDHLEPQPNQEDSAGLAAPLCAMPGTARWHRPHACARTDRANPRSPPPPPTAPPAPPSPPPVVPISLAIESPPGSPVLCAVKRPWSAEEDERLVQVTERPQPSRLGPESEPNAAGCGFGAESARGYLPAVTLAAGLF